MANAVNLTVLRGRNLDGRLTLDVAGNTSRTLNMDQCQFGILEFTGALTGNINIIFPDIDGLFYEVMNNTTGDYTVTAKVGSATGLALPQGRRMFIYLDGTDARPCNGRMDNGLTTSFGAAGNTVLTTAQAASNYLLMIDGGAVADFTVTYPLYSVPVGHIVYVDNQALFHATVKFGTGDTGVVIPSFTSAPVMRGATGAFLMGANWNLTNLGFSVPVAGSGASGLQLLSANYTVTATATQTLAASVFNAFHVRLAGTPGAQKTLVFPVGLGASWCVYNGSDFQQLLKITGDAGSGITIPAARRAIITAGATAMERVTADSVIT